MHLSLDDFWKVAAASELLSLDECESLAAEFAAMKGAAVQANVSTLAQWLVARGTLTEYQAAVLSEGRAGPFVYGPFVVVDRIEKGRFARTYRATYEGSQDVFLVFLQQLTSDAREYQQYAKLAETSSTVKHPHVSRTFRVTRQRGQSFIVTEALSGRTLDAALRQGTLAPQVACQIAFQVALGLVALHEANLTHGGVCPRNIWIDQHGAAKLLQFPLVQPASRQNRFALPLVDYLAPEWTRPEERATPLVDLYGLGCVLYQLIAGRVPFPGGSEKQKIIRHRAEFPQRLDELNPRVPEELADLAGELLTKDPMLRCQSATEAAHLLARFAAGPGAKRTPPKLDPNSLTPGYGAWQAPAWQAPPQQEPRPRQAKSGRPQPEAAPRINTGETVGTQPAASRLPQANERKPNAPRTAASKSPASNPPPAIVINIPPETSPPTESSVNAGLPFINTDAPASSKPTESEPKSSPSRVLVYVAAGLATVVLIGLLAGWWLLGADDAGTPATAKTGTATPTPNLEQPHDGLAPAAAAEADSLSASDQQADGTVDDDGETLWVSPTAGPPLDLAYLPSGAQLILALRPAELLASPEGPKLLAALGPSGSRAMNRLRTTLGVDLEQVEQLLIGFVPDENLQPRANYVMRLRSPVDRDALLKSWGQPMAREHDQKEFFERSGMGYYLPDAAGSAIVAMGPIEQLKQMLELDGQPLLRAGIEDLLEHSDQQRQLSLLFTPSYLLTDGRSLLSGGLDQLHDPIRSFLDESIKAVLVSADVRDDLFVEFRAVAPIDRKPLELEKLLRSRWAAIPEQVESHVAALRPQPHGQLVIHRFPRMLQLARDYTRSGVDDGQVVMSCYLPAAAAHNLLLGAELTLLESQGVAQAAAPVSSPSSQPKSAEDALRQTVSLSFPREALDRAMELLSHEIGVPIEIAGGDLQLEGITKNQSLNDLNQRDQPAADVLRVILKLANPDGKLVYQIRPDGSGRETIVITTRAAVEKRGERPAGGF